MKVIELEPVDFYCPHCDSAMEWTTCQAPMCRGYRCLACGDGCDLYENPKSGRCVRGLTDMSYALADEIREERRLGYRYGRRVRTVHLPEDQQARLDALAEYYDNADLSAEVETGQWVYPRAAYKDRPIPGECS